MIGFGIDIGGSGVKGAPVDIERGVLAVPERFRIPTPQPAVPDAVLDTAAEIVRHFDWQGAVGCALPAVVQNGRTLTAANIDESWIGVDARALLRQRLDVPVTMLNDADAAGLAEDRYGAGRDQNGVVLVLTFGTGIGSGLFTDGVLVPNTEFGHLEFHGGPAEHYCAARLVEDDGMHVDTWAERVNEFLCHLERVVVPDLFVFGGGISKRFDSFSSHFTTRAPVVAAELRNEAGIVGAALASTEAPQ